jgi:hypothetical protein
MAQSQNPMAELQDARTVPFDSIYLDPNNPRIAPESPPGYGHPELVFDAELQNQLEHRVREVYDVKNLEESILAHGWVPIDSILVWEHPAKPGYFIVVEGNTRTVALRSLRGPRLEQERKKLEKLKKSPRFAEELRVQQETVARIEEIVAKTNELRVFPVAAKGVNELLEILPRLLGVRHITHAREWKPYATNLYILSLYEKLFRERHGPKGDLRLEDDLVNQVGGLVSLGATKTRRNIQAASAFTHFRRDFEDRLPEGEQLTDEDHYFFELILQNAYPKEQFGFTKDALKLSAESQEVLFQWAFSQPRPTNDEEQNNNVLYKAESIRLWNQMSVYDGKHSTNFAKQLDVNAPEQARPIRQVEGDFLQHKNQSTPVDALTALVKALQDLKVESLISQQEHLKPIMEKISQLIARFSKMMEAV